MKKVYVWRYLTHDGLLKIPEGAGPSYNRDYLDSEYDTEQEAIADYEEFAKLNRSSAPSELVLLCVYRPSN